LVNNRVAQAFKLYNILLTRKNAFRNLLEALAEINQSGALALLTSDNEKVFDDIRVISFDENVVLGHGCYGTVVYKGKFGIRDVAVKMIHSNMFGGGQALHEIGVLQACDAHENIVRYFGTKQMGTLILIALELCDVSLKGFIESNATDIEHIEILKQVTIGLEWLHSQNIVHRDLKPENILLTWHLKKAKLSDFGLSRRIINGHSYVATSNAGGTPGWNAPEILALVVEGKYSECKYVSNDAVISEKHMVVQLCYLQLHV